MDTNTREAATAVARKVMQRDDLEAVTVGVTTKLWRPHLPPQWSVAAAEVSEPLTINSDETFYPVEVLRAPPSPAATAGPAGAAADPRDSPTTTAAGPRG